MNGIELNRDDSLHLEFAGDAHFPDDGEKSLDNFRESLEAHAGELTPVKVKGSGQGSRWKRLSPATFRKALVEARTNTIFAPMLFVARDSPYASFHLTLEEKQRRVSVNLDVSPLSWLQEPARAEDRSLRVMELVRAWSRWCPPQYAVAHSVADWERSGDPNFATTTNDYNQLHNVFWLNVLGPGLVESLGRERVLATPAHLVEPLPGGAVLLLTRPTLADVLDEEGRVAQARALAHLRPALSFDTVLAQLRQRSALLAKVEPRFHPDVAELLESILDHTVSCGHRQQRIAEMNAYQPPPVEEWLPRGAMLPPDVPNPEAVALEYEQHLSEYVVALLDTKVKVPALSENSPAALTSIDSYLWSRDYPGVFPRDDVDGHLVPAVGAYLGTVLVKALGGRWVPRRNLDESQVLLGERAWLPFLRARRFLKTRQSLIDFSLTGFYRTAERHLRSLGPR